MFFYEYPFPQTWNMFSPVILSLCVSQVKSKAEASWQATSWGILVSNSTQTCCSRDPCGEVWLFQGRACWGSFGVELVLPSMKRLMEPGMWCELPALGCTSSHLAHLMPVTPLVWDNSEKWDPFWRWEGSGRSTVSCCSGLSYPPAYKALRDCSSKWHLLHQKQGVPLCSLTASKSSGS